MREMLFQTVEIAGATISNRIGFSPMGCVLKKATDGVSTDQTVEMFRTVAKGGAGLLIQGATAVSGEYRVRPDQTGIWCDEHIPALRRITEAVHAQSKHIFVQLEHPGPKTCAPEPVAPMEMDYRMAGEDRHARALSTEEVRTVVQQFAAGAVRAQAAGYDGVELHATHGHLLSCFLNHEHNRRADIYGQDRYQIFREILSQIRKVIKGPFPVGVRIDACDPDTDAALANAKMLAEIGYDFLDISHNSKVKWIPQRPWKPEDYPFDLTVYTSGEIKKNVSVPVFAVGNIRTEEEAQAILETAQVDLVLLGRGLLADPEWVNKVCAGEQPDYCLHCPQCKWKLAQPCPGHLAGEARRKHTRQ